MTTDTSLPLWARKPNHRKTVIATDKGWVVESTGEILVSHKNLKSKLDALLVNDVPVIDNAKPKEPTKKKPGRPKGSKNSTTPKKKKKPTTSTSKSKTKIIKKTKTKKDGSPNG